MNPLRELSLADLRTRNSMKWRAFDADVLPLWVAEMDTALAEPVKQAIVEATPDDVAPLTKTLEQKFGFRTDVGHLTVFGHCASCAG